MSRDDEELILLLKMAAQPLSYFEVRRARLSACMDAGIRWSEALRKARTGEELTEAEYVFANGGILPCEAVEACQFFKRTAPEMLDRGENPRISEFKPSNMIVNWKPTAA